MAMPVTRYAKSGDVHIAYQVSGEQLGINQGAVCRRAVGMRVPAVAGPIKSYSPLIATISAFGTFPPDIALLRT